MLTHFMRRIRLLVLLFATLIVVEPVVHSHPLVARAHSGDGSTTVCACAAGTSLVTSIAPAVVIPAAIVVGIAVVTTDTVSRGVALTLPSRAPPAI
jgi:hypothetical protein